MIIDTHVHYTEPASSDRPYLYPAGSVWPISEDDLIHQTRACGVSMIVQVTPSCMGYDNRYSFEGATKRPDTVLGVVGRLDPFKASLQDRLEQFMQQPKAIGIRHTLHHDWAADWLADGKLDPFFMVAQKLNVPVFIYVPDQAQQLLSVAEHYPGIRFVVDHTCLQHKAKSIEGVFEHWPSVMKLGQLSNVWLKVSYFPEAAAQFESYPFPTSQARFQELYETVGAQRMVWGSNLTPVTLLCSYANALKFINEECQFLSPADRADILGANFLREFKPAGVDTKDMKTQTLKEAL
jgi:predicted TIM-barrel fold metal-dependent hydrolase